MAAASVESLNATIDGTEGASATVGHAASPERGRVPAGATRVYVLVALVSTLGAIVIAKAVVALQHESLSVYMIVLAALAILSGRFAIKVPGRPATVSVSEVFVFASVLWFGPAAATLTVAVDGLVVSLRQNNRRFYRTLFNVAEPALTVWTSGLAFFAIAHNPWVMAHADTPAAMLPTLGMAAVFFGLNSALTAIAVALENDTSAYEVWRSHAIPLVLNYYAAASLASLTVSNGIGLDFKAIVLVVPLLVVSYAAYREAARSIEQSQRHVDHVQQLYKAARQKDEELRQAQKLEAIGRLAGGVAHDFNNILTAIHGYGGLLRERLPESDPRRDDLEEILKAAERAAGLTRQLLTFSRRQVISPKALALGRVIADTESMLRRLIGEDIQLVTDIAPGVGLVMADSGQMEQVLINLVVNARDAMPDGGTLRIEVTIARPNEMPAKWARGAVHYVRLSVADTGSGISESALPHIFDPFFTTKEDGRGTGLGLSTVYGIVEQAGGSIEVLSKAGHGTTFHVYLPQTEAEAETAVVGATDTGRRSGSETILVVEDDPPVAAVVAISLKQAGYTVLEAANADQALDVVRRHEAPIDLLLTDVVMPGRNGRELTSDISKMRREIRVLYMSGYSDDVILRRGIESNSVPFIQKPFSTAELAAKVREVLQTKRA